MRQKFYGIGIRWIELGFPFLLLSLLLFFFFYYYHYHLSDFFLSKLPQVVFLYFLLSLLSSGLDISDREFLSVLFEITS